MVRQVQIHSFLLHHRSASPRSRDSKIKREKDIKTEEEEDLKKKEKVRSIATLVVIALIWWVFLFTLRCFCPGPTFISGGASCKEEGRRGSRGQGENVSEIKPFCPF